MDDLKLFGESFRALTGNIPFRWQERLFQEFVAGRIPAALDLPTGLGKTSVMAIWLIARALADDDARRKLPRRLVYVVDRRVVVDQATTEAEKLREALEGEEEHFDTLGEDVRQRAKQTAAQLKKRLGLTEKHKLPISTLRGQYLDNREWLDDPSTPAIIVGTVDMIGSRLLFSGYGVSRKMRPYHAGLLGADALVVLDEAHLVPPFAHLLRAIEGEASLWPKDRAPFPRFIVLPLSATQRERPAEDNGRKPFGLEEEDWRDEKVFKRLNARKQLYVEPLAEKDHERQLAEAAVALATKGPPARVVVFCGRREKKDDGIGPSAQGVAEAIESLAKGDKKAGREKIDIDPPELLVGARRVREREQVARRLRELGFTSQREPAGRPAFVVATSAGEVGIDLDADHMVCDLAPWERVVQRLGRVNRRGSEGREAQVIVFDTSTIEKDEGRKALLTTTRDLLKRIETDFGGKAGPATLLELRGQLNGQQFEKATTPEPLHPALTRALADAWSMTSLEHHTGRPEVAPWLRGWVEEKPQTTVIWRTHLPIRSDENGRPVTRTEIEAFFEAAPPHESEKLETETFGVVSWLMDRAKKLRPVTPRRTDDGADDEEAALDGASEADKIATEEGLEPSAKKLQSGDVVAYVLSPAGDYRKRYIFGGLADDRNKKLKGDLETALSGATLVMDARFGGLADGLLSQAGDGLPETADGADAWSKTGGFRVRLRSSDDDDPNWPVEAKFILTRDDDGDPATWLSVEHFRDDAQSEDGRSVSRPQELGEHISLVENNVATISNDLALPDIAVEVLALAALLHDEGKRASRWQRAFKAERDAKKFGLSSPLGKTCGPIDQSILDGYRHEFGSLAVFEEDNEWAKQLPADVRKRMDDLPAEWRDLVLHLIAAHHGQARPVIATRSCEDGPPSALEERACEVALRFATLQKRWGPWSLAWWEALLRAADQQASRDNEAGGANADARAERP